MSFLPFSLAALPFLVFIILLVWKKTPLIWVSLTALLLVILPALFFWKIIPTYLLASLAKGFLVALDIFFIIFGALFFLGILKKINIIENLTLYLKAVSKDIRVQVILLAWYFENFLEGTAGFGSPSTVVAPLLIGLGITPINAVIIALLGNSASAVFGAAGTPIKVGFGDLAGRAVAFNAGLINIVGFLVPVFMLWYLTKEKQNSKKEFWEALPFAIWSGILFTVPSLLVLPIGQEFPSILGSTIGLILILISLKIGLFIPKTEKKPEGYTPKASLPLAKVVFPYVLLIILLILGKFLIGSTGISIPLVINHTFSFFNPGFAFILVGLIAIFAYQVNKKIFLNTLKNSFRQSLESFFVIAFMSCVAQIMVNSSFNYSSLPSMINLLAVHSKNYLLPLIAPFIGNLGSFLTGSLTVSNLMFGNFLAATAKELALNVDKILALTVVGGAAGNMIALADIIVAETVVGLKNQERKVLGGVIIPCLIYTLLVGIIGLIFVYLF